MRLPGEQVLRDERLAVLATIESLSDEELESGTTLCEGWTPRDVMAHMVGVDRSGAEYVRARGNIRHANAVIVERARALDRDALMAEIRRWATDPPLTSRLAAGFLIGDVSVHHQDILRGLGRRREVPAHIGAAILREGIVLGPHRLLTYRLVPDDGGRAFGRGQVVRGSSEALGLWLTGRRQVEPELVFVSS